MDKKTFESDAFSLIGKVKQKREFSQLPDSIVKRALEQNGNDVKLTRAYLRKYFGVFLTNKVVKPKNILDRESVLKSHISSKKRDYKKLYGRIFDCSFASIVDLGAGVNGFSILELHESSGALEYYGIEASGQVVDLMNKYFDKYATGYEAHAVWLDLFELEEVKKVIRGARAPKAVFCFQVVDALESFEKDHSKKFISEIMKELSKNDIFVLSFSTKSLSGRKNFDANRKWLVDFIRENFDVKKDFEMFDERFIVIGKK